MKQSMNIANAKQAMKPVPGTTTVQLVTDVANWLGITEGAAVTSALTGAGWVTVLLDAIRVTFDGSDPVATSHGMLLAAGYTGFWSVEMLKRCRTCSESGADAQVVVTEFG